MGDLERGKKSHSVIPHFKLPGKWMGKGDIVQTVIKANSAFKFLFFLSLCELTRVAWALSWTTTTVGGGGCGGGRGCKLKRTLS